MVLREHTAAIHGSPTSFFESNSDSILLAYPLDIPINSAMSEALKGRFSRFIRASILSLAVELSGFSSGR